MGEETKPVAFRLTPEQLEELDRRANEKGLSRSDYVREAVLAAMDESQQSLRGRVESLEIEVLRDQMLRTLWALNRNMQCGVVALLCDAGRVKRSEAEKWVREEMDLGRIYDARDGQGSR